MWICYLLHPVIRISHEGQSLLSVYRALVEILQTPHTLPLALIIWALQTISSFTQAKKLVKLIDSPCGWEDCDPSNKRLVMRKKMVKVNKNLDDEDYLRLLDCIKPGTGQPECFLPTCEGRMCLYTWMEKAEMVTPENLETLLEALTNIGMTVLVDELKAYGDNAQTPLFDGITQYE